MKVLYLDCGMGVAGDMLAASLYDLLSPKEQTLFLETMDAAGIPHTKVTAERVLKSGIAGTQMRVVIRGEEEETQDVPGQEPPHGHDHEHPHDHGHPHEHGHHHAHHSMEEIRETIRSLQLPEPVIGHILRVYDAIAEAESRIHGTAVSEVHLHEVGMLDAIADIASVCLLMDLLHPDRVIASPVTTGYGAVRCAHGILPVPAPATTLLLEGLAVQAGDIEGELCTPTGAALVSHFAGEQGRLPEMKLLGIGYGMGKKEFARLNCVRATLGEPASDLREPAMDAGKSVSGNGNGLVEEAPSPRIPEGTDKSGQDTIAELACNLDDMTGEDIGYAVTELLAAGAADVWTTPVQMKKNRPGVVLTVLCREEQRDRFVQELFRLTTTIGIRETLHRRYILDRRIETCDTPLGAIRKKVVSGYGVAREKLEYEDLAKAADRIRE